MGYNTRQTPGHPDAPMVSENGHRERVAIFIDGSNLYHSLEENCRRFDLDFGAFSSKLSGPRTLFRTYYYNVLL